MTQASMVALPNGWLLKPAGRQSRSAKLREHIAGHPIEPIFAVLRAGYSEHEVVTLRQTDGRLIGHASLPASLIGLLCSTDGTQLFTEGGFNDCIYCFDQADELLCHHETLQEPARLKSAA